MRPRELAEFGGLYTIDPGMLSRAIVDRAMVDLESLVDDLKPAATLLKCPEFTNRAALGSAICGLISFAQEGRWPSDAPWPPPECQQTVNSAACGLFALEPPSALYPPSSARGLVRRLRTALLAFWARSALAADRPVGTLHVALLGDFALDRVLDAARAGRLTRVDFDLVDASSAIDLLVRESRVFTLGDGVQTRSVAEALFKRRPPTASAMSAFGAVKRFPDDLAEQGTRCALRRAAALAAALAPATALDTVDGSSRGLRATGVARLVRSAARLAAGSADPELTARTLDVLRTTCLRLYGHSGGVVQNSDRVVQWPGDVDPNETFGSVLIAAFARMKLRAGWLVSVGELAAVAGTNTEDVVVDVSANRLRTLEASRGAPPEAWAVDSAEALRWLGRQRQ